MKSAALHFAALAAAVLATGSAHAISKKTFCTITINSSDEREVLRKNLPADQWEIKELVPARKATDDDDDENHLPGWLESACNQGVTCDALAISGHFGGTFFGTSGFELSLEQMERASCRPGCAGIFKKPKEVFLMGCNTLAGKNRDRRTPEQYLRALLADHMDRSRAEQTVALRYSTWGAENAERMKNVFSGANKIYGFDSIGPSGATAGPRMSQYIKPVAASYSSYVENLTPSSAPNMRMKKIFDDTSFIEVAGKKSAQNAAICFLEDDKVSSLSKIRFVESQLLGASPNKNVPAIAEWVKEARSKDWSDAEGEFWDRLTWNPQLRAHFLNLADSVSHLPGIESTLYHFARDLRWITDDELDKRMFKVFKPYFDDKKITVEERDAICSAMQDGDHVHVDYSGMGIQVLDIHMVLALTCLGTIDQNTMSLLQSSARSANSELVQMAAVGFYLAVVKHKYAALDWKFWQTLANSNLKTETARILLFTLARAGATGIERWNQLTAYVSTATKIDWDRLGFYFVDTHVPSSIFPVLLKRFLRTPSLTEVNWSADPVAMSLAGMIYTVKADGADLEFIAKAIVHYENDPQIKYALNGLGNSDAMPETTRYRLIQMVAARAKNQILLDAASSFLNR